MDFNEFINSFGENEDNVSAEQWAERSDWLKGNGYFKPLLDHIAEGINSGGMNPAQMVESLYTVLHPDISPQAIDVMPFYAAAAHGLGCPSIVSFFHGMHVIHIPGAFALLAATHRKINCPCGDPPTRSFDDATEREQKMIHEAIKICFTLVVPDELMIEPTDDGDFRIVKYDEADVKNKPELMDKLVANWRRELDSELPTVIPDHERNDEPGGPDWMKRWT